jgi:hypothetical protein
VLLDVTYVGNRGNKLDATRQYNSVPRQYLATSPVRDQAAINFLGTSVGNPFASIPDFTGTGLGNLRIGQSQLLLPYPEFAGISTTLPIGYSYYHSLQVAAHKRFSRGFTFQLSWTWSKFMEATGFLNATDPAPEKVISDQDFTHSIVMSGIYELPLGRGKPILGGAKGLLNGAIGGWQVQGIYHGRSGQPLGFGNAIFNGNLHDIVLPVGQRKAERWFNVDAGFVRDPLKQLGDNIRTFSTRFGGIRADGINAMDLSVFKNFRIRERLKVQFRAESNNAFNHVMFGAPNTNPTSTTFGTITGETGHGPRRIDFGIKLLF